MRILLVALSLLLAGCGGSVTAQRAADFAVKYCEEIPQTARVLVIRGEANAILASKDMYVCIDCPGPGDECTDRSKVSE